MVQASWSFVEEVWMPDRADGEGNSPTSCSSQKGLGVYLKLPGSPPDH